MVGSPRSERQEVVVLTRLPVNTTLDSAAAVIGTRSISDNALDTGYSRIPF